MSSLIETNADRKVPGIGTGGHCVIGGIATYVKRHSADKRYGLPGLDRYEFRSK